MESNNTKAIPFTTISRKIAALAMDIATHAEDVLSCAVSQSPRLVEDCAKLGGLLLSDPFLRMDSSECELAPEATTLFACVAGLVDDDDECGYQEWLVIINDTCENVCQHMYELTEGQVAQ